MRVAAATPRPTGQAEVSLSAEAVVEAEAESRSPSDHPDWPVPIRTAIVMVSERGQIPVRQTLPDGSGASLRRSVSPGRLLDKGLFGFRGRCPAEAQDVVGRFVRLGGGMENEPVIVGHCPEPALEVARMIRQSLSVADA